MRKQVGARPQREYIRTSVRRKGFPSPDPRICYEGARQGAGEPRRCGVAGTVAKWGDLRLVMLGMFADGPAAAQDLIQRLQKESGGRYVPSRGSIYPRL